MKFGNGFEQKNDVLQFMEGIYIRISLLSKCFLVWYVIFLFSSLKLEMVHYSCFSGTFLGYFNDCTPRGLNKDNVHHMHESDECLLLMEPLFHKHGTFDC